MPDSAVVDASALIAVAFDEPDGPAVAQRLEGRPLIAPSLLQYEIANVTLVKARGGGDVDALVGQLQRALATDILLFGINPGAVFALAVETGLSAYDAAYLWLAEDQGAELVTLDARLQQAAADRLAE